MEGDEYKEVEGHTENTRSGRAQQMLGSDPVHMLTFGIIVGAKMTFP